MTEAPALLLIMLLAHVVLDFVLPLRRRLEQLSNRLWQTLSLCGLGLLQGIAVLMLLGLLRDNLALAWQAGACVAIGRIASGGLALKHGPGLGHFFLEQAVQLGLLLTFWLTSEAYWGRVPDALTILTSTQNLLILLAYLLILMPASTLIATLLRPWLMNLNNQNSLKNAGTYIGYLERCLILTFVLLDQWEAIGFLLTAKSILRFNELHGSHQRPMSEYVLLGTLLSFALSIGLGLLVQRLISG